MTLQTERLRELVPKGTVAQTARELAKRYRRKSPKTVESWERQLHSWRQGRTITNKNAALLEEFFGKEPGYLSVNGTADVEQDTISQIMEWLDGNRDLADRVTHLEEGLDEVLRALRRAGPPPD